MSGFTPTDWDLYYNPKFAHVNHRDGSVTLNPNGYRLNVNHPELSPWYFLSKIEQGLPPTMPMSDQERDIFETRVLAGRYPAIYLGNDGSENAPTRPFEELFAYAIKNGIDLAEIFAAAGFEGCSEEDIGKMARIKILNRQIKRILDLI